MPVLVNLVVLASPVPVVSTLGVRRSILSRFDGSTVVQFDGRKTLGRARNFHECSYVAIIMGDAVDEGHEHKQIASPRGHNALTGGMCERGTSIK